MWSFPEGTRFSWGVPEAQRKNLTLEAKTLPGTDAATRQALGWCPVYMNGCEKSHLSAFHGRLECPQMLV